MYFPPSFPPRPHAARNEKAPAADVPALLPARILPFLQDQGAADIMFFRHYRKYFDEKHQYGNCSALDCLNMRRVVNTASPSQTHHFLPSSPFLWCIDQEGWQYCQKACYPGCSLFSLRPSGRRYRSLNIQTKEQLLPHCYQTPEPIIFITLPTQN